MNTTTSKILGHGTAATAIHMAYEYASDLRALWAKDFVAKNMWSEWVSNTDLHVRPSNVASTPFELKGIDAQQLLTNLTLMDGESLLKTAELQLNRLPYHDEFSGRVWQAISRTKEGLSYLVNALGVDHLATLMTLQQGSEAAMVIVHENVGLIRFEVSVTKTTTKTYKGVSVAMPYALLCMEALNNLDVDRESAVTIGSLSWEVNPRIMINPERLDLQTRGFAPTVVMMLGESKEDDTVHIVNGGTSIRTMMDHFAEHYTYAYYHAAQIVNRWLNGMGYEDLVVASSKDSSITDREIEILTTMIPVQIFPWTESTEIAMAANTHTPINSAHCAVTRNFVNSAAPKPIMNWLTGTTTQKEQIVRSLMQAIHCRQHNAGTKHYANLFPIGFTEHEPYAKDPIGYARRLLENIDHNWLSVPITVEFSDAILRLDSPRQGAQAHFALLVASVLPPKKDTDIGVRVNLKDNAQKYYFPQASTAAGWPRRAQKVTTLNVEVITKKTHSDTNPQPQPQTQPQPQPQPQNAESASVTPGPMADSLLSPTTEAGNTPPKKVTRKTK